MASERLRLVFGKSCTVWDRWMSLDFDWEPKSGSGTWTWNPTGCIFISATRISKRESSVEKQSSVGDIGFRAVNLVANLVPC